MARTTYIVAFIALLPTVLCCGNMEVTLKSVDTNCPDGSPSVLQISPDFGFTMSDSCIITPTGCAEFTKEVDGAKVKFTVTSALIPKTEGEYDGCEVMKNASQNHEVMDMMKMFNVPTECPMKTGKVCAEGQVIDVSKHSGKMMFISGTITANTETLHKDGSKSCFNAVVKINPKPMTFTS